MIWIEYKPNSISQFGSRSVSFVLTMWLVFSCGQRDEVGRAILRVSSFAVMADDVTLVSVEVCGEGIPVCIQHDLAYVNGQWKGTVENIPAGKERIISVEAFDSENTLILAGQADNVMVLAGRTTPVTIFLQQVQLPESYENSVPRFESVIFSKDQVGPEESVTITVSASDPNDQELAYSWTSNGGSFSLH